MSSSLVSLKAQSEAKQSEEQRRTERKKGALVLMLKFMHDYGYVDSANVLQQEANLVTSQVEPADNVDLLTIVQEWEEYQEMKFGRRPKLIRKASVDQMKTIAGQNREAAGSALPRIKSSASSSSLKSSRRPVGEGGGSGGGGGDDNSSVGSTGGGGGGSTSSTSGKPPLGRPAPPARDRGDRGDRGDKGDKGGGLGSDLSIQGAKAEAVPTTSMKKKDGGEVPNYYQERLLKPLPDFGGNLELRELASSLTRDIWMDSPDVRWNDVVSLDRAKSLLQEAVVMPIKYPQLFTGLLSPWKGVLLYGPPGTGKTMLAKAVATECRTTFFNISASSIVSKWRGDSEKLVRVLFELARYHAPSTIFLDEIDSILSQRSADGQEHEGSRRLKTELLIQMDGLVKNSEQQVFVLAASNLPWDLDVALLRRLEKRIYVPLPNEETRTAIFRKLLSPERAIGIDHNRLGMKTKGYSGADCVLVCKEAAMRCLRKLVRQLEGANLTDDQAKQVKIDPVTQVDVEAALEITAPSAAITEVKYEQWMTQFGSS